MNILETFYFMFKGDTTDLEKGQKRATKLADDLEGKLKNTQGQVGELSLGFMDLATKAAELAAAYFGVTAASKAIFGSEQQALNVKRASDQFGLSAIEIGQWGYALQKVGGDTNGFIGEVKKLNSELNNSTMIGGRLSGVMLSPALQNLKLLGVDLGNGSNGFKSWKEVLLAESDLMSKMEPQTAANWSSRAGNSDEMTRLLMKGRDAIRAYLDEGKPFAELQAVNSEKAGQFAEQWTKVTSAVNGAALTIGGPLLDALVAIINPTDDVKQALKELAFAGAAVLTGVILSLNILFPALLGSLAALAIGVWAAVWPFLAIAAAIGVVWGIIHYGPKLIHGISDAFKSMFDFVLDGFGKIGRMIEAFFSGGSLKDRMMKVRAIFEEDDNKKPLTQPRVPADKGTGGINSPGSALPPEKMSSNDLSNHEIAQIAKTTIVAAQNNPLAAQGQSSIISKSSSQQNSFKIDNLIIETQSTDAEGIVQHFGDTLSRHANIAIANYDTGTRA